MKRCEDLLAIDDRVMTTLAKSSASDKPRRVPFGGSRWPSRRSWTRLPALVLLTLGLVGCGPGRQTGFEVYVPTPAAANDAVLAVLDAWKQGRPLDEPVGPNKDIHCVDKQRRPGQTLAGFDLLGETEADNARGFLVRLHLQNPEQTQVARFLAVGTRPLWVFRGEDYEMIAHWMHPMPPSTPANPAESALGPPAAP